MKGSGITGRIMVLILLVAGMLISLGQWAAAATGSTAICRWKDNKTAAYTRSHDDGPVDQIPWILDVLNARGISMTFYRCVSLTDADDGYRGGWDEWQAIVASAAWKEGGHEYGSHTVHHPNDPSGTPTDSAIRSELRDSKARIEEMLPENGKCLTIAYSSSWCNDTIMARCAEYYIAGRGTGGMMLYGTDSTDYTFHNAYQPFLTDPSRDPAATPGMYNIYIGDNYSNGCINAIIHNRGWLNVYSHGIEPADTALFVPYCDYIYAKRDSLWCGSERDVVQYIYERDTAVVQVSSASAVNIVMNLTHDLDTARCNFDFPLTLRTEVDSTWDSVSIVQGSRTAGTRAKSEAGKKYAYFNVRPNQGVITLAAVAGATAIRQGKPLSPGKEIRPAYPNPIRADVLRRYLETNRNVMVYDLAGKPADLVRQPQAGLYILQGGPMNLREKIMITE